MDPLQCLIAERLGERGWSYGEVARRGALPRSTVYTLASTRNLARPPRAATIDALARGLDVPVSEVRAAAARPAEPTHRLPVMSLNYTIWPLSACYAGPVKSGAAGARSFRCC
jgi:transcriptional regulator with XRE-family HTH domain